MRSQFHIYSAVFPEHVEMHSLPTYVSILDVCSVQDMESHTPFKLSFAHGTLESDIIFLSRLGS